jgi:hypothetical protein
VNYSCGSFAWIPFIKRKEARKLLYSNERIYSPGERMLTIQPGREENRSEDEVQVDEEPSYPGRGFPCLIREASVQKKRVRCGKAEEVW